MVVAVAIERSTATVDAARTPKCACAEAPGRRAPHFRDLVAGSIEGILIHRQFKPLFANPTFTALLGYQRVEDILALASLAPHIAAMERARIQPPAALPVAGTAPLPYECDAVRQDGETITLRGVTRRIDWDGGPAWQTTVIDVTEQRRAERRLRQRQCELARMTQLSAVAETAGQLAHELNQRLTAILCAARGQGRAAAVDQPLGHRGLWRAVVGRGQRRRRRRVSFYPAGDGGVIGPYTKKPWYMGWMMSRRCSRRVKPRVIIYRDGVTRYS